MFSLGGSMRLLPVRRDTFVHTPAMPQWPPALAEAVWRARDAAVQERERRTRRLETYVATLAALFAYDIVGPPLAYERDGHARNHDTLVGEFFIALHLLLGRWEEAAATSADTYARMADTLYGAAMAIADSGLKPDVVAARMRRVGASPIDLVALATLLQAHADALALPPDADANALLAAANALTISGMRNMSPTAAEATRARWRSLTARLCSIHADAARAMFDTTPTTANAATVVTMLRGAQRYDDAFAFAVHVARNHYHTVALPPPADLRKPLDDADLAVAAGTRLPTAPPLQRAATASRGKLAPPDDEVMQAVTAWRAEPVLLIRPPVMSPAIPPQLMSDPVAQARSMVPAARTHRANASMFIKSKR